MTHLGIRITGHDFDAVSFDFGDANIVVMAPIATKTIEGTVADGAIPAGPYLF